MSSENINAFLQKLQGDADLKEKINKLNGMEKEQSMREGINIAREAGFEITIEELESFLNDASTGVTAHRFDGDVELSEQDLSNVAGGYVCLGKHCASEFAGSYLCSTICCIDIVSAGK